MREEAPDSPLAPGSTRARFAPLVYLALTLAWVWPLPLHLTNRFTHDPGDPLLETYLIWWNAHARPLSDAMWNAPYYWPLRDAVALTEHGAGMSIVSSPVQWLGGSPLLAYNLLLIGSIWWSALAAHALVRRLTGSGAGAFCAGLAYAFAPYRAGQLAHLHVLLTWWMPLALLGLHAYYEDGRRRWLLLFGASWLLQALTNGYFLFFFPVLLGCWVLVWTPWRLRPSRAVAVAVAFAVFSLPLVPVLLKYYTVQQRLGLARTRGEMQMYGATWASFLHPSPLLLLWTPHEVLTQEDFLFPGVTAIALILAALACRRGRGPTGRALLFYASAAVLMAWMAAGPAREQLSLATLWHAYGWVSWLPGFAGLRAVERFFMLATLCLSVAAGLSVAALTAGRPRRALVLGIVASIGLLADGWIRAMPLGAPPSVLEVPERNARVLELPFEDGAVSVAAMYRGMSHRLPVINGYAGYVPPHADVIAWALRRRDPTVLTELRRGHPLYVLVASTDEAPAWTAFLDGQPETTMLGVEGGGRLYRMAPAAYAAGPRPGAAIADALARVDGDWIVADVGRARAMRGLELRTGGNLVRLPRDLRIDVSVDGTRWETAFEERPGGMALLGALQQPLVIPLRVDLRDVSARYVRVNAPAFGAKAVTVFGLGIRD